MQDDEVVNAAAEILRSIGLNAGSQDTGAGTLCLVVAPAGNSLDEPKFWFGTAAEFWAAEMEGEPVGLSTDVPSSETDAGRIAAGILNALAQLAGGLKGGISAGHAPIRCPRCGASVPWERMNDATHFRLDCPQTAH